ncbi:putative receptor-like protein kinase At4g00960 isoform X1 [Cajanus cajan]|uniref:Cysteine-rich receptor-like protein kinase 35 n=2 Tax=Cajanus cajan TaxID=3821 RepID=A0A151T2C9_CAJCA|nr:putative receptor-like protein kinase At4g00960 isoform X1 [Cajanus cajan]KYP61230.1 Putative cysteine-rich receptor-like protein kinase 35 [Cajanus cajan]
MDKDKDKDKSHSHSFLHSIVKHFKFGSSKERDNEADIQKMAAQEQKIFAYETLAAATKNFSAIHKLGEGGFGPVYKGKLNDGREIAVKKLSHTSNQGKKEFMNEAKLLARVQHRNVVNLVGYCVHGTEKLLVYEYVAHESLDKLLFKSHKREELDWKRRFGIITGVAKGLLYLHEDSHNCIIHRDIKASNILLDDKWTPKIADFGMARLFPEDQSQVNTRVAGTNGYMAPEYVMHGNLSVKADVFSYGVLVLELISGQRNSSFNLDVDAQNLLDWAYKMYKKGKSLEIVDCTLECRMVSEEVAMCIQLGLLCTQGDPQLRPTMRRVVVMLSRKPGPGHMSEPTRPGVPGSRYRRPRRHSALSSTTVGTSGASDSHTSDSSNNYTTVTTTTTATVTTSVTAETDLKGKRPMREVSELGT